MISMEVTFSFLIWSLFLHISLGERTLIEELLRQYLMQGTPFEENMFLDNVNILPEYDFIIVGSGPSGSTIANRLSEISQWNVLLLEAGFEGNLYNNIPAFNEFTVLGNFSQNYNLEREDNACLGLVDGICHWPSGNGIGGATLINGMLYTRGHPSDFDRWAFEGNPGWSYSEVLPYFLKFENMSIPGLAESEYHSTRGPVHIQYPFQTKIGKLFLEAGQEMGYELIDYNNPNTMIGFSQSQTTIRGVRRESAASAYLFPANSRPNLHIVKNAFVTQVLTDIHTRRVFGVNFIKDDKRWTVWARNEVVLSAGAFGSPKILMLSGIGPEDHLLEMGIPAVSHLPVGYNLQEHLGAVVTFLISTNDSATLPKLLTTIKDDFYQWLRGENGGFSNNIPEALGYIKTKFAQDKADIELILIASTVASDGGVFWRRTRNISDEVYYRSWGPIFFEEGFTIAPMLMYPRSRGFVRLKSTNPRDPPVIKGNFLSDPLDVLVLIEGIRRAINVAETITFQQIGAKLYNNPIYGCETYEFNSDAYWECVIRTTTIQFHHQSGTCRMGLDPLYSVVDPRLRVHGLTGLRVADASIMPTVPGTHTMAPCYMIGEKAADMIKQDWGIHTDP